MNGSLAVWCDTAPRQVSGLEPRLDLHFNMWLDLPGANSDVLDIGILFKEARQIEQLNLYVPALIPRDAIIDLSEVLHHDQTLSAVFNSTLFVGADRILEGHRKRGFEVRDSKDKITLRVVCLDFDSDVEVELLQGNEGTIIKFTKSMFLGINEVGGAHYVRFRIKLKGELRTLFRNASNPHDSMLRSGFHSTDVIEFRVNERRNFGDYLRKIKMEFPKIEAIHYFLVRDISTELVQSHADFRKMRRLEPKLWDRYLRELGTSAPERWIIFHWREGGIPGADVEDFIALAFFTKPRYHLLAYLAVIVLLGAAGSGIQALWTLFMNSTAIFCDNSLWIQVWLIVLVMLLIGVIYLVHTVNWRYLKDRTKTFCSSSEK